MELSEFNTNEIMNHLLGPRRVGIMDCNGRQLLISTEEPILWRAHSLLEHYT